MLSGERSGVISRAVIQRQLMRRIEVSHELTKPCLDLPEFESVEQSTQKLDEKTIWTSPFRLDVSKHART